jgi:hypothetical protein
MVKLVGFSIVAVIAFASAVFSLSNSTALVILMTVSWIASGFVVVTLFHLADAWNRQEANKHVDRKYKE